MVTTRTRSFPATSKRVLTGDAVSFTQQAERFALNLAVVQQPSGLSAVVFDFVEPDAVESVSGTATRFFSPHANFSALEKQQHCVQQ